MDKLTRQYNARSWVDPRVVVRPSGIQGQGGFAREAIHKDEIVGIIGGTAMTEEQFQAFAETATQYDAVQIGEELHLVDLSHDPRATNGSFNHSCDSNLWLKDEVTIFARRDIQSGEELTIDYALFTASPGWVLDIPCRCGSPLCRQTVSGSDWRLPEVQARYRGHFSPFLNQRIAALT
jgi:uncharacterized protein